MSVFRIICDVYVMMTDQLVLSSKSFPADLAFERSFSSMTEFVGPELVPPVVLNGAVATGKLSGLGVPDGNVLFNIDWPCKFEITLRAGIRFESCVYAHVVLQIVGAPERFGTHFASVGTDFLVTADMSIELVLHVELTPALGTTEGTRGILRVVNLLVGYQCTLHLKHLSTFITRVLVNVTMNRQMSFYLSLIEVFGTNFTLRELPFLEHVFLCVLFYRHDTVGQVFTSWLVASKNIFL